MDDLKSGSQESTLEKTILELIARDLGIRPDEVTLEFIHQWRNEHLYPHAQVDLNIKYGGYNNPGRQRILSHVELKEHQESAEDFLESWRKKS